MENFLQNSFTQGLGANNAIVATVSKLFLMKPAVDNIFYCIGPRNQLEKLEAAKVA